MVWHGRQGKAGRGEARKGMARCGTAGMEMSNSFGGNLFMVYKWKSGSRIKADPEAAGKQFEALAAEDRLTAKNVVDENRPDGAALHSEFEWDDKVAAESYREVQASKLIRSICVVESDSSQSQEPVRAYVTVEPHRYEPIQAVIEVEDKRGVLLKQALRDMQAFERKYRQLQEMAAVIKQMESTRQELCESA